MTDRHTYTNAQVLEIHAMKRAGHSWATIAEHLRTRYGFEPSRATLPSAYSRWRSSGRIAELLRLSGPLPEVVVHAPTPPASHSRDAVMDAFRAGFAAGVAAAAGGVVDEVRRALKAAP